MEKFLSLNKMQEVDVLGFSINPYTKEELLKHLSCSLNDKEKNFILTANPETLLLAQKNSVFREAIKKASISLADGIGLIWASNFLSYKLPDNFLKYFLAPIKTFLSLLHFLINKKSFLKYIPERIAGSDLIWDLSKLAEDNKKSVFLLGGGEKIAEKASEKLKEKYADLKIAGFYSGKPSENNLVEMINKSGADFLMVAWGQPKQEIWIGENFDKLNIDLVIGLGGTFDFLAGKIKRAPKLLQKIGFEWFWRLLVQPARISRTFAATFKFIYTVCRYKINSSKINYEN